MVLSDTLFRILHPISGEWTWIPVIGLSEVVACCRKSGSAAWRANCAAYPSGSGAVERVGGAPSCPDRIRDERACGERGGRRLRMSDVRSAVSGSWESDVAPPALSWARALSSGPRPEGVQSEKAAATLRNSSMLARKMFTMAGSYAPPLSDRMIPRTSSMGMGFL